jgi:hypothetical protein
MGNLFSSDECQGTKICLQVTPAVVYFTIALMLASLAPIAENKGTGHLEERPLSVFATNNPQDFVKQATTIPGKLRKKHIYGLPPTTLSPFYCHFLPIG